MLLLWRLGVAPSCQALSVPATRPANFQEARTARRIILTASGGAFRDWPAEKLKDVTVEQATSHPNWSMGKKITIDRFGNGRGVWRAYHEC